MSMNDSVLKQAKDVEKKKLDWEERANLEELSG